MEREVKTNGKEKKKADVTEEELTEEDRTLKENLDLLVERIVEDGAAEGLQKAALEGLR